MKTIEALHAEWQKLQPLSPENQKKLDQKFMLDFNFNSNHLEGNTLTYGQTKLLLIFGDTTGDAKLRDYEEMKAHNVGLELVKREALDKTRPLTESFIRDLNRTILVENFWKAAKTPNGEDTRMEVQVGAYKTRPNSVITATGEEFEYASPQDTPVLMSDLVAWYNAEEEKGALSPLELASLFHYRYIRIHPFEDGNGRIARLLVNYILHRHGYPMVVVRSDDKESYLRILHQCDVQTGLQPADGANASLSQIKPFIDYLGTQLHHALELGIKAAKGESIEEPDDIDKELLMWKKNAIAKKTNGLRRNDDLVYDIFSNGLKDLIVEFTKKHILFFDMFQTSSTSYYLNTDSYDSIEELIETIDNLLTSSISGFVDAGELPDLHVVKDSFTSISITIDFEEYKLNPKNPFSMSSMLDIDFQPYKYIVSYYTDELFEKDYSQNISLEERNNIISKCMRSLLKQFEDEQNS